AVFKSAYQGLQARGGTPDANALGLYEDLTHGLLASKDAGQQQAGVELAGLVKIKAVAGQLRVLAGNPAGGEAIRKGAVQALGAIDPQGDLSFFAGLMSGASDPSPVRAQAAQVLGASGRPEGREHLVKALATAPARLEKAIALALASSREGAVKLLEAVAEGKASARLLQEQPLTARLRDAKIEDLEA